MIEKIILDMLTQDSVSVKKEYYYEINGELHKVGSPWRKAYINSERGRNEVKTELPEDYKNAIFAIWGDTPTVTEHNDI